MGVSNYTPTGISHATSVDFSKRSVNQPVHIVQYDKSLPILAVSLYNNGQLYRLSESMEVSIRLGKPDRTFVYNKALGCDSTRTIVYFEITQQMSLFDGEYYPVIEIMDGDKIANSSTIYLVVDRNPVQHDYIESTIEYKELVEYRDEAVKSGKEAKESAKIASDSAKTAVDKAKEAVEASETAVNAANSASESAESILGVEENVTRIGNMVSEKEPIITAAAETASTSATNARQSETNAKASEEAAKLSETNAKDSEDKAKASEEAAKLSETNAKDSETNAKVSETNAKASADSIEEIAKASESYAHGGTGTRDGEDTDNARYYMEQAKAVSAVDVATADKAGIVKPDGTTITVDNDGTLHGHPKVEIMTTDKVGVGKPDGTTITVDEDGTLHGSSSVDEMTGATAEKDGASGTVPAPLAGDQTKFLRGDGTWAEVTGGAKISPKATVNPAIMNGNAKVTITWGDPEDVVADGVILSTWKGTKLVMKDTGYPENENDGTVLVDNKTKDAYVSTGYEVTGLTNGNTYYFKLFPYSTDGIYNYQDSNKLLGNPSLVKLDPCTNMSLSLAMGSVTVSWTDPEATKTVDGNTATWAKTVLVYKQGSIAPMSISDGIIAVEETVQNTYSTSGFEVLGLTDGQEYTFALFAISTENSYSDAVSASVQLWATLNITTTETTLYEKEVTVTNHVSTVTGTFSSTGSISLNIPWIGSTVITATDGTETGDETIEITAYMDTYSLQFSFSTDGATVTPINDVTTLVKCAGVPSSSSYTTIADILGNDDTIGDITMSENAMKYLARSTGFAEELCANETFMTFLGQSLYVDYTVLNSDLWVEAISSSSYWDLIYPSVTVHSSASATITVAGKTFTSDVSGNTIHSMPWGTFSISDSVSGQSFERTINRNTTEIFVMPEGALYWYGNECDWLSGGWSVITNSFSTASLTKQTNELVVSVKRNSSNYNSQSDAANFQTILRTNSKFNINEYAKLNMELFFSSYTTNMSDMETNASANIYILSKIGTNIMDFESISYNLLFASTLEKPYTIYHISLSSNDTIGSAIGARTRYSGDTRTFKLRRAWID